MPNFITKDSDPDDDSTKSSKWVSSKDIWSFYLKLLERRNQRACRVVAIILSVIVFHFFPAIVLTSYMGWEGFFSYDMFSEGVAGIAAFYWWAEMFLIVGAVYMIGSVAFAFNSKDQKPLIRAAPFVFLLTFIINCVVIFILSASHWPNANGFTVDHLIWLFVIAAWIIIHVTLVFTSTGVRALISLGFGFILLTGSAVFNPGVLALPYTWSLQFFGNGGGLRTSVQLVNEIHPVEGRLVLVTPEHIYLYPDNENLLSTINRNDVQRLSIANLSGFGHARLPRK